MFNVSLNVCKNILVVVQMMVRLLCKDVFHTLYPERDNRGCYVPVLRTLTGDHIFRSVKSSPQKDDKKTKSMGMRIGRRKYMVYVAEDGHPAVSDLTDVSFSDGIKEPTVTYGSRCRQNHAY